MARSASIVPAEPPTERAAGVRALQEVGAAFYGRGWSLGTSSNYSVVLARAPFRLLITASGKDKGRLGSDDFVVVDEAGRPVEAAAPRPSAETMLHVALAHRPGGQAHVGAVLHTHSVWGTLLSDRYGEAGGLAIEGYEMLKGLAGVATHAHRQWVPIFENTQDIPALARQVGHWLDEDYAAPRHGFLICRHGLYTWGRDLDEARRHVEIFEFLFEVLARRFSLEGPVR